MSNKNKTHQELEKAYQGTAAEITRLQNEQARTALHLQMQRQGVTSPDSKGFVAGNDK